MVSRRRSCGVRNVVLNAFGCGASLNPPETVARCYCNALLVREQDFDCVAFAVGFPENYSVFDYTFEKFAMSRFLTGMEAAVVIRPDSPATVDMEVTEFVDYRCSNGSSIRIPYYTTVQLQACPSPSRGAVRRRGSGARPCALGLGDRACRPCRRASFVPPARTTARLAPQ